jgi:hypothetical protein
MKSWLAIAAFCRAILACTQTAPAADVETPTDNLQLPEGPICAGDTLYFVNYSASSVFRLIGDIMETVWHQDGCGVRRCCATVITNS